MEHGSRWPRRYSRSALDRVVEQTESHGATGSPRTTLMSFLGLGGQVSRETQHNGDDGTDPLLTTKSYSYDAYGHRTAMTDAPNGGTAATYTYGYDVHGSVSLLLADTGAATASYGYRAYGGADPELTKGDLNADNPLNAYRYSAKRLDSGSGSIDMGARRFGPDTARFLQRDSFNGALSDLGLALDPLTQNRYALAGGNPISFVEWDGHRMLVDGGGGGSPTPNPGSEPDDDPGLGPLAAVIDYIVSAGAGFVSAGSALAKIGTRAGRELAMEHTREAGRALRRFGTDTLGRDVGRFFRNPAVRAIGRTLAGVGVVLTAIDQFNEEGNDGWTAFVETGISVGVGFLGGLATVAFCSSGVGTVACLAGGIAIAVGATGFGEFVGEAFAAPLVDFSGDVLEGAGDLIGEAGGAVGGALGGAGDAVGDFFGGLFGG